MGDAGAVGAAVVGAAVVGAGGVGAGGVGAGLVGAGVLCVVGVSKKTGIPTLFALQSIAKIGQINSNFLLHMKRKMQFLSDFILLPFIILKLKWNSPPFRQVQRQSSHFQIVMGYPFVDFGHLFNHNSIVAYAHITKLWWIG